MSGRREYDMTFRLDAQMGTSYSSTFAKAQEELAQMQKEIRELNTVQANISGYQKQQASVEATRQKLSLLQTQYDNIQKEIQETGGFSSELENKLLAKKAQIDKTAASLKENEEKLDKMGQALRDAGVDTDNLTEAQQDLEGQIEEVKKAQEKAAQEAKKHSKDSVGAIEDLQSAMVAAGIAKLYKEIAQEAYECAKASIEYESALTGVYKTVDGTDKQLNAINREIKEMATEIPASTTEIAAVAEAAGQLGIQTENVMEFTRVMIDLGESTNLSAEEAASSLAKFSNITGMLPENYERLGSVIVGLGNNFATTEADIVAMGTRLASAGKLAGFTEAEIMALAAAMSSVGIEAEAGGTAMTQTLNAIETAVAEGGENLKKFARVSGMSADEFASAWETAPMTAVQAFMTGVGNLEDQGESAVLVLDELGLTGIRQSNMIKSLGLASGTLANAVSLANAEWEENNALSEEAGKRYATTESRLKMLKNSYTNLQIAIGDVYNPALQEAIYLGQDMLDGATEFVEENPEAVKAITAISVGVGGFSLALAGYVVASKAATVATKARTAAMASNPYLLAGAAIIGVVAALGTYIITSNAATKEELAAREERKRLKEVTEELRQAQLDLNEARDNGLAEIEANAFAAETLADKLDSLMGVENKSVSQKEEMAAIVDELNELYPDLNLCYDKEKDLLTDVNGKVLTNTSLIRDNIAAQKEQAIATVYMDDYIARLKEAKDAETAYSDAVKAYDTAVAQAAEANKKAAEDGSWTLSEIWNAGKLNDAVKEAEELQRSAFFARNEAKLAAEQAWSDYEKTVTEFVDNVGKEVEELDNSEESQAAGEKTGQAYADAIKSTYPEIQAAIDNAPSFRGLTVKDDGTRVWVGPDGSETVIDGSQQLSSGYAIGTDYATPGYHLVGEKGPELVYFGGGEKVYTADETRAMLNGNYTAVSFAPLMSYGATALSARADTGKSVSVVISPIFNIEGGSGDDIESKLSEYSDIIVAKAMDALEEAGIDAKRGAYA